MAKSLTPTQKAINVDIKHLDENFTLPTPCDYEEFSDFQHLVRLKEGLEADTTNIDSLLFEYDMQLHKILDTAPHIDELLYQEMTAEMLGLPQTSRSLLRTISDSQYADAILLRDEDLHKPNNTINLKIQSWLNYCQLINQSVEYINTTQPRWNKMGKVDKREYIESLQLLKTAPFIHLPLLEITIEFLKNYSLNQTSLAKANFLCSLQLPKITDLKTAKEILKKTTFSI